MAESSSGMDIWACLNPNCTKQIPLPRGMEMKFCPGCGKDQASFQAAPSLHLESPPVKLVEQSQNGKADSGSKSAHGAVAVPAVGTEVDPLTSGSTKKPKNGKPDNNSSDEYEDAESGKNTNGNSKKLLGPPCQHCPERLLTPEAVRCESCGKQQRGTGGPQVYDLRTGSTQPKYSEAAKNAGKQNTKNGGKQDTKNKDKKGKNKPQENPGAKKTSKPAVPPDWVYLSNPKDTALPKGFLGSGRDLIKVTFHVIVPLDFWEWDSTSKMCLQFGHQELGRWTYHCGLDQFRERPVGDRLSEMTCELSIHTRVLQQTVAYKYLVLSQNKDKNSWYETIPGAHNNPNRALVIPKEKLTTCQGIYHQFDTFSYPNVSKSWYERTKNRLGLGEARIEPLSTIEMRQQALTVYLEVYRQTLCMDGGFAQSTSLPLFVRSVQHIFFSLLQRFIYPRSSHSHIIEMIDHTPQAAFKQTMKEWCQLIVINLLQKPYTENRMVSALCLTWLIKDIGFEFSDMSRDNFCIPLSKLLCLQPDTDTKPMQCLEFDHLCKVLPAFDDRVKAANAIKGLLHHLANDQSVQSLEWLFALPLYNLFKGIFTKFGDISLTLSKDLFAQWAKAAGDFPLKVVRNSTFNSKLQLLSTHYKDLEPLFVLDPLLLQVFTYICPKSELGNLFGRIPPNVSMSWLSISDMTTSLRTEAPNQTEEWVAWMNVIAYVIREKQCYKEAELFALIDCSKMLLTKCVAQLCSPDDRCITIVKASLSLALVTICHFDLHYPDSKSQNKKDCKTKALNALDMILRWWIDRDDVIGKRMFGGFTHKHSKSVKLIKDNKEIKIWKSLLTVDCPSPSIKDEWLKRNKVFLKERVNSVPEDLKLDLLVLMKGNTQEQEVLTSVVFDAAVKAIDAVFSESSEHARRRFEELTAHQSQAMGTVLGTIVARKYPRFSQSHGQSDEDIQYDVTLVELLEWYLWPNFLQVFSGGSSELKAGLPPGCQSACVCALTKFHQVCDTLQTGDILVGDLWKVEKNKTKMQRLCKAVTKFSSEKGLSYDSLNKALQERLTEFQTFQDYKKRNLTICNWIPPRHCFTGLDELKQDLDKDYSDQHIKDLCGEEDGKVVVKCFSAARPLDDFAKEFSIMMTKRSNLFVRHLEKKMGRVITLNADLEIASISTLVWKPTFEHCQKLLESLSDLTIKLVDVDKHLQEFSENLETQVLILSDGISDCLQTTIDTSKLRLALTRVRNYWKLCEYRHGADVFLKLREVLDLQTGDFSAVEKFSTEFATSMTDQTLADVDDNLVQTGRFLEDVANHPHKKACLEKFVECQNIIKWLKSTTKDVSDIQGFVTVALATAAGGEDDHAHDRLSNLRTVGSGFASFIYNIKEGDGYKQLEIKCMSLWEALQNNPELPKLLNDCNKDISWYQSVKDTQASVETTSYGQMRNILKYGCYKVGAASSVAKINSINDLISMRLEERDDKEFLKKVYTLDELRDLESKLVLICGSKAESRTEVDHYLNLLHNVQRIAEVFLDLQQGGNVEHSRSTVVFRQCARYEEEVGDEKDPVLDQRAGKALVDLLQTQAKDMENILDEWKAKVQEARLQYYHLNCYTTLQLLTLRKELGPFKTWISSSVPTSILVLLQSVSAHVTGPMVKDAVLRATAEEQNSPTLNFNPVLQAKPDKAKSTTKVVDKAKLTGTIQHKSTRPTVRPRGPNHPSVRPEHLSEAQQAVLTNCVTFQGFSELHVLKAYETLGLEANRYDIEGWCDDNKDVFAGNDYEGEESESEDEEDESSSSGSSDESDDDESLLDQSSTPTVATKPKEQTPVSLTIKTVTRQTIDKHHPVVQKLMEADFKLEESIDAVERFGELGAAMDFLESRDASEEQGLFEASTQKSAEELTGFGNEDGGDLSTPRLIYDPDVAKRYLSLDELGRVLELLGESSTTLLSSPRRFDTALLKSGHPNLLVTPFESVLRTVLALYMEDANLPLPTQEEVLICNPNTTAEEVILLWRKSIFDPGFTRIFCLAHAERLSYQVCDDSLRALSELSQGRKEYRLVIVCSKEDGDSSPIFSRLHLHKRLSVPSFSDEECREYLMSHFVHNEDESQKIATEVYASSVDLKRSCVRIVSSARSGMGKSLYVQRMTDKLKTHLSSTAEVCVTVPIHGPVITLDMMLDLLESNVDNDACTIYHIDIAPSILPKVDTILFSLLVLRGLTDSKGRVWRCHPRQLYAVEVTAKLSSEKTERSVPSHHQTLELLKLLPSVECISPNATLENKETPENIGMDRTEFEGSTIQRVYQYMRRFVASESLDRFSYDKERNRVEGNVQDFLRIIQAKCGITDASWAEIHHFNKFLDVQLISCEECVFCDESLVGDVMSGLKGFAVKCMIRMSQDFSTPSLENVQSGDGQQQHAADNGNVLDQYQIAKRRQWEQSSHPYIFFNRDRASITFVGFRVNSNGNLVNVDGSSVIERSFMKPSLYKGLDRQGVSFDEDYRNSTKAEMIVKLAKVMGISNATDPDKTYVLTVDNLVKMLAIQMRFRCDIPVVIMGETGCGKTRLIRYMCDLAQKKERTNMLIMKIHGGITDKDVTEFILQAETVAEENKEADDNMDTVVFFDEANTTDSIGLIKEIMCDRRLNGRPISKDLKFIAACNPYRRHTEKMIEKLENAGLGFYVRESETQQKLGEIPLRQLVYRVLDLPPSMRPLVYDFGQLNTGTEHDYVKQIVKDHVELHSGLSTEDSNIIPAISSVLAASQKYMRDRNDECSFVSLRDVERAMIIFEYFYEQMDRFAPHMNAKATEGLNDSDDEETSDDEQPQAKVEVKHPSHVTRALIIAVSISYHARLHDREEYEEQISAKFQEPLILPRGADQFRDEIKWCQEVLLDNMRLGPNIAKNAALRENVFMMAICIELRIPLFLVGKPGSSKSLAKSIIQDSMHGPDSHTELLRGFKQVHIFSYQCSQLSTPESVIEVFKTAERFQAKQDTDTYVSVVVLDEVGLAEDSPNLPLKALHPLLEDGTEGTGKDYQQRTVERNKRVAFIGISNWALDPAKMNRGVMVTRGDLGLEELKLSARGICSNKDNDPIRERLQDKFDPLSRAYMDICKGQERQFFGLRDFYSLIKMLYWMCDKSEGHPLSGPQLEHAIKRNFGGLESAAVDPIEVFNKAIDFSDSRYWYDFSGLPEQILPVVNPDCSRLGLIKTSLSTKDTTWHGENRYLLFLTENYAALDILGHYLEVGSESAHRGESEEDAKLEDEITSKPFTLFGSSFPKDKDYTQICRNINQIKICMETGRTVILLNLENLYESLYDVLNQYYMYYGGVRYVDLGLQTHRVKCRVHDNFKLILIAEKNTVYEKFPTPLINRLEKHFVLASTVLEPWQQKVLVTFLKWIHQFSNPRESSTSTKHFEAGHAFIGHQKDTPAAVVFQATNQLKKYITSEEGDLSPVWQRLQKIGVLKDITTRQLLEAEEDSDIWKEAVIRLSQYLLLQTASEDALFRLKHSKLLDEEVQYFMNIYYHGQEHMSIVDFLKHYISQKPEGSNNELFMQVTTHSHLLTREEMEKIPQEISVATCCFGLHEFDTELDFSNKIGPMFQRADDSLSSDSLIIIQCDSGHLNSDLIACARYRIYDESLRAKYKNKIQDRECGATNVLFIVRLPPQVVNSNFVGFQGDPWISVHIDDVRQTSKTTVIPEQALSASISELFVGRFDKNRTDITRLPSNKPFNELTNEEKERSLHAVETSLPDLPESAEGTPGAEKVPIADYIVQEELTPTEGELETEQEQLDFHPQHRRLYSCIQAAVSSLSDSGKDRTKRRLQKLICLIPNDPKDTIDNSSFYGLLVKLMYGALKERERARIDEEDWVVKEAMNARNLLSGGTFRNVLARRIDEVITPYFAEVIARIDETCNLDLMEDPSEDMTSLSLFWLSMFAQVDIDFSSHMLTQGKTTIIIETNFRSQLPFSWMVKDGIDSQLANTATDTNLRATHTQVCEALSQTMLGESLDNVLEEDCEQLYRCYLHDFVQYNHKSKHTGKIRDMEHMLIADSLNGMVHAPELCSIDGHESLTRRVTALHLVFEQCRSQILWFGELVLQNPGILTPLSTTSLSDRADTEFNLHLLALEKILTDLGSPLAKDRPADNLSRWLNYVRLSQNMINSILNLSSDSAFAVKLRLTWQRIRAVQMFVEHVLLPYSDLKEVVMYVRRLDTRLSANSDFLKKETLETVKKQVNNMIKNLKLPKSDKTIKSKIKKSCHSFFMEVVSSLCFGGSQAPETELIKSLVDTVLCGSQTKELSPYEEARPDKTPTIRSFVLQLLLEHSPQQVKEYLDDYFKRSVDLFGGDSVDQGLCLLCIQCFEDALYKEMSTLSPEDQLEHTLTAAAESYSTLQNLSQTKTDVSLDYLEAIAKARYSLSIVAENLAAEEVNEKLIDIICTMCTDTSINTIDISGQHDTTGPVVYLLKLIVRQFGFPCLKTVSQAHPWVVPQALTGDEQAIDPFVVYQKPYISLRDTAFKALTEEEAAEISLEDQTDSALLAVVLYQEAALTHGKTLQHQPKAVETMDEFVQKNDMLSEEMKRVSRLLLSNQQGGPLAQMTVAPHQLSMLGTLRAIVVHTASVMMCHQKVDFLMPLISIYKNPAALANSFLPSMPQDFFAEVFGSKIGGAYYECKNGHPYLVGGPLNLKGDQGGSCPSPTQSYKCKECGVPIGKDSGDKQVNVKTVKTGHSLGEPKLRQAPQRRERYLSAHAVCIVRAVMHSAFIWASCNNDPTIEALAQLVSPQVSPQNLPEYFWQHLERDLEDLNKITSRGADECAMIIHIVLSKILTTSPPSASVMEPIRKMNRTDPPSWEQMKNLGSKNARVEWERLFSQTYVDPVLEKLEKRLKEAMDLIAGDDKQGHDQLFYLAYERVKMDESRLEPHLWTFRSRINVNHLRNYLIQQRSVQMEILDGFLQEEENLRATVYLPDIVKLQHFLFSTFHRKLEKSKAKTKTIRDFLKDIKNENTRNEYRERIDSLKKAWALVGQKLKHHKRLPVEEEFLIPAITDDTELEYLIPTTMGEGRCTTSLVDFLVLTHNSFIEKCRGIVKKEPSSTVWIEHSVPITHIHRCHLLDFDQQLQSIILSHCHYSLTVGKGQDIKYDLPALEKHILNRFIYGKPMIHLSIPHVAYRQDVYTADKFLAIRQKVKPQVAIPQRIQQDIITELRTPDRLRETLDVVDIVLGYLSSAGGNSKVTLDKYLNTHKMKNRPFSAKAKEYCTLGHIISLWETISVELARQLWLTGQEPFEGIPENYSRDLSEDEDGDNQFTELDKCLRTFDLGLLLGSLFEFIEVHVKHTTAKEEDWAIVEPMEFYREGTGQEQLPQFGEEFPYSIKVDQAVATWKHMVKYQEKISRD